VDFSNSFKFRNNFDWPPPGELTEFQKEMLRRQYERFQKDYIGGLVRFATVFAVGIIVMMLVARFSE